ncbi:root UVB sensitive [Thalictrum thalictroides]|uniref:Root UVB sensitive n=1 Tax=Thalictrum thalictroides TaxID=46969 RepID=A0A7J6W8B7_THATH|nr:root UVB sensitive [Thalictrum thalictroides]
MQSTSYISNDSFHLQPSWKRKTHKPHFNFNKFNLNKPKTLTLFNSIKTSYKEINSEVKADLFHLPIGIRKGGKISQYFWDGSHLQLVSVDGEDWNWFKFDDGFEKLCKFCCSAIRGFLIPNRVQEKNYMEYVKWKFLHRVFSSALQVLATQAMFRAMGVGFSQSLPSAAALNWVLKDGLGRLSRCIYTASLASAFDTNLKRVRFSTSIIFTLSIGVELLTPFFPSYFLLLATMANIAKQISLACYLATASAVHRSFAVGDNLCEISAKAQLQTVCFDNLGLILAALLNYLCRNNQRVISILFLTNKTRQWLRLQAGLPLFVYPIFSAIDLFGIYQGLKHVHLQTLTKDRLEIIVETWIQSEFKFVPSPAEISKKEGIDFPWFKGRKRWPIRIGCVDPKAQIPKISMLIMRALRSEELYFVCMETSKRGFTSWQESVLLSLRKGADTSHIIIGLLQACHIRKSLLLREKEWEHILANDIAESVTSEWFELVEESHKTCAQGKVNLLKEMKRAGWAVENILLSTHEQVRYSFLGDKHDS